MDSCEQLATSRRAYIIAPAGCGKTYLIAESVTKHGIGRSLILTHTHAGVDALRRKLHSLGASSSKYHLDTIAGWALRYAAAYPKTSALATAQPSNDDWPKVYSAATQLLSHPWLQEVVRRSYSGVYVDEYQDCTTEQHKLVLALAKTLPCRILGDPLQGIFGFKNNILVDWDNDVSPNFEQLPDLPTPWRWSQTCPQLGEWLMAIRQALLVGNSIDLSSAPKGAVRWVRLPSSRQDWFMTQLSACRAIPKGALRVVAIHQWEAQCNKLTNALAPLYCNIETIECDDLLQHAAIIESSLGIARVDAVLDFAANCITGINQEFKTVLGALRENRVRANKPYKRQTELGLLTAVRDGHELMPVLPALDALAQIPGLKLWRRDLFHSMCQSLREFTTGKHETLKDAAWTVRNRTRHYGRAVGRRAVARTLLVKGLEFDHCIILDAESLKTRDLYVALTRAACSLTILSRSRIIRPSYI